MSLVCLALSMLAGILLVLNRLRDFLLTTQLVKTRSQADAKLSNLEDDVAGLGQLSWRLFWLQVWLFLIGLVLFVGFILSVALPKLD